MVTRMKRVLVVSLLVTISVAAAGASHVSAVARKAPDAPVGPATSRTVSPRHNGLVDSGADPTLNARPAVTPPDVGFALSAVATVETTTVPATSTVARPGDTQSIGGEQDIDALEREIRELKLRYRADRLARARGRRQRPAASQAESPIALSSNAESLASTQVAPAVAPQPSEPVFVPSPLPAASPSDIGEGRWIDVDLTHQRLTAYDGSSPVRSVAVSTGLPGTPTPVGQFRVWVKLVYDDMEGPGYYLADVPYTMYFHGPYGLHGTYWHSNFGHPMSHGCVNLPTTEAEWLFGWAEVGTLVNVHN